MASMLVNAKSESQSKILHYAGCSCHNTKNARREVKHAAKQREEVQWKKDAELI
jgi:hypothetical protein